MRGQFETDARLRFELHPSRMSADRQHVRPDGCAHQSRWRAIAEEEEIAGMMFRPEGTSALEFVKVSALRAAQLMRGCTPRVTASHKATTTAQHEVAAGKVRAVSPTVART